MLLGTSVFTAQETNVHWNEETSLHLCSQCQTATTQFRLATSTSTEKANDWFKSGGTLMMTLNQWTGCIISSRLDPVLGCWSYLEFIGKNDKYLVILSGYCVCNQQFDAASQTVMAQQIRLLQARGIPNPKPRTIFINDLIQLILQWQHTGQEVIICINANDLVDDPKSEMSCLFQETYLTDLHQHKYPSNPKPATQQCRSKTIDLIAGSLKVVEALIHTWICPLVNLPLSKVTTAY